MSDPFKGSAEKRYEQLKADRTPYISRAQKAARLTISSLEPRENTETPKGDLIAPAQGLGAYGVNNLASKLLLALLPPNSPFFRMHLSVEQQEKVEDFEAENLGQTQNIQTPIEKALAKIERRVMDVIETSGDRNKVFAALKQILIAGTVILQPLDKGVRMFTLPQFVIKRDPRGNTTEIVLHEQIDASVLEERERELFEKLQALPEFQERTKDGRPLSVFTHVQRKGGKWEVQQEVMGKKIPSSFGTFPIESPPYIVIAPIRIDGEDYGRAYVEEYIGDLETYEILTLAITEGAQASAWTKIFVNPNGLTVPEDVAEGPNGKVVTGDADDVSVLQIGKAGDFRVAQEIMGEIERRLERAFLLNATVQRNAERVTAEEIRFVAAELEDALGGLYSILSEEFQRPYVNRRMHILRRKGLLPRLPKNTTRISIVTGLEALGRTHDGNKLRSFITSAFQLMGPQAQAYLNNGEILQRLAVSEGIETEGLIKSEEDVQQELQEQQIQALAQQVAPEVTRQGGQILQQSQTEGDKSDG